jgi:hypothetical protein
MSTFGSGIDRSPLDDSRSRNVQLNDTSQFWGVHGMQEAEDKSTSTLLVIHSAYSYLNSVPEVLRANHAGGMGVLAYTTKPRTNAEKLPTFATFRTYAGVGIS